MQIKKDKKLFDYFVKNYWDYYIEMEEQFLATKKYVAFDKANFKTYSSEYLKLLEAVCSEIDIVGKEIAHQINPAFAINEGNINITKWWFSIQDWVNEQSNKPVKLLREIELNPWKGFSVVQFRDKKGALRLKNADGSKCPSWWDSYNKVKHTRTLVDPDNQEQFYKRANLENVALAFAALYTLEKLYMMFVGSEEDYNCLEISKLFEKKRAEIYVNAVGQVCVCAEDTIE